MIMEYGDVMGLFDGIGSAIGGFLGGPVGAIAGNIAGSFISGQMAADSVNSTNFANAVLAQNNSAFNAEQAQLNRDFQAQQAANAMSFGMGQATYAAGMSAEAAQRQMDFQERMANTSWQRAVDDLAKAGLNPMLAYSQGGNATPAGAMSQAFQAAGHSGGGAQGSAVMARMEPAGMAQVSAALNTASTLASVRNMLEQNEKIRAETRNIEADTAVKLEQPEEVRQRASLHVASARHQLEAAKNLAERLRVLMPEEHAKLASEVWLNGERSNLTREQINHEFEKRGLTRAETRIVELEIPKAINEAKAQESWWMRNISPYMGDFTRGVWSGSRLNNMMRR